MLLSSLRGTRGRFGVQRRRRCLDILEMVMVIILTMGTIAVIIVIMILSLNGGNTICKNQIWFRMNITWASIYGTSSTHTVFNPEKLQRNHAPLLNCDSDEGGEEGIDHGEDQEECGLGGLSLQVSHSTYISKH